MDGDGGNVVLLAMATLGLSSLSTLSVLVALSVSLLPSVSIPREIKEDDAYTKCPFFSQKAYRVTNLVVHLDCVDFILHGQ